MSFFFIGQVVEGVNRDHLRGNPDGESGEYVDVRVRERYTDGPDPLLSVVDLSYGHEHDILSSALSAAAAPLHPNEVCAGTGRHDGQSVKCCDECCTECERAAAAGVSCPLHS